MRRKLPPDLLQRPLAIVGRQVAPAITRFEIPRADISSSAASRDPAVLHRPSGPPLPRATTGPRGGLPLLALLLILETFDQGIERLDHAVLNLAGHGTGSPQIEPPGHVTHAAGDVIERPAVERGHVGPQQSGHAGIADRDLRLPLEQLIECLHRLVGLQQPVLAGAAEKEERRGIDRRGRIERYEQGQGVVEAIVANEFSGPPERHGLTHHRGCGGVGEPGEVGLIRATSGLAHRTGPRVAAGHGLHHGVEHVDAASGARGPRRLRTTDGRGCGSGIASGGGGEPRQCPGLHVGDIGDRPAGLAGERRLRV